VTQPALLILPEDVTGLWTLPEGWEWRTIRDVAFESSVQVRPANTPDATFNYWGLDAINKGGFQEPKPNFVLGGTIESACVFFDNNAILYSKLRPYLNKVITPSISGIGTTEWIVIKPRSQTIDRRYLAYFLRTQHFVSYATQNSTGARMPRIIKTALWSAQIPVPYPDDPPRSLWIQRAIVARIEALLSELREINDLHATIDGDVAEVMESVYAETLASLENDTKCISVASLIKSGSLQIVGGSTPKTSVAEYWNGKTPWVTPKDMKRWAIEDAIDHVSDEAIAILHQL
jgi:type I restriction enzyme, S subunit